MSEPRHRQARKMVLEAEAASHDAAEWPREGPKEAQPSTLRDSTLIGRPAPDPTPLHPPFRMARVFALPARLTAWGRDTCEAAVQSATPRGRVRVWVPCCKTGAATYTVAMLLTEASMKSTAPTKLVVFGTDQDEEALAVARAGRYPMAAALGMDPGLRAGFMRDEGDLIRVSEALRQVCIFSRHELLRDPPMARMDLIVSWRVFDGLAPARRAELVEGFHFALRDGGLLLALDHAESFPEDRFERLGGGRLRVRRRRAHVGFRPRRCAELARAVARTQEALAAVDRRLAHGRKALHPWSSGALGNPADVGHFVHTLGVPLLLCAADLRVIYLSREAREAFDLSESERGAELDALSARLPGGLELVSSARQVAAHGGARELAVRTAQRLYLARLSAARDAHRGRSVSILFTDVTPFEAAAARGTKQEDRHAALARLSKRSYGSGEPGAVYEEALDALCALVPRCSSAAILTFATGRADLEVVASRGLGPEPLQALRNISGAELWLASAIDRDQGAPRGAERPAAAANAGPQRRSARGRLGEERPKSAPAHPPGIACPIAGQGEVFGVLAVLGPSPSQETGEQDFLAAMAGLLAEAIIQRRTRRRLELEREASELFTRAATLGTVGAGLLRALRSYQVEAIEIGAARGAATASWERLYPEGADAGKEQHPRVDPSSSPVFIRTPSGGEVLVAADRRAAGPCLLRLRGAGLCAPDPALAEGLRFIAQLLAGFLDRSSSLELARDGERIQREQLEALYSALPVVVSIHDATGALRRINRRIATLDPAAHEPVAGKVLPESKGEAALGRLYAQEIPAWIARVLATDAPVLGVELTVSDGGDRWCWLCNFAPIRDVEGNRQGVTAVVQDISPLQRLEATLREANRTKDDFFALLGHELRNPIAAIVDNLVSNALRFTSDHGSVVIEVQRSAEGGLLRVADDGVGVEPEFLRHLFEPFRQGRSKGRSHGLGLGLALVKGLCDLHGFRFTAHSDGVDRGATFVLELPLVEAPDAPAAESRADARSLDLLLVEDNEDVADTLTELLRGEGHRVEVAGTAERALEMLRECGRDVVLCDIGLPGMDGIELARRVRGDPELSRSRLVALTGFGDAATEARIERVGFVRSLIKPVQIEALRRCLSRMAIALEAPPDRRERQPPSTLPEATETSASRCATGTASASARAEEPLTR